jgi:hypothetical protein
MEDEWMNVQFYWHLHLVLPKSGSELEQTRFKPRTELEVRFRFSQLLEPNQRSGLQFQPLWNCGTTSERSSNWWNRKLAMLISNRKQGDGYPYLDPWPCDRWCLVADSAAKHCHTLSHTPPGSRTLLPVSAVKRRRQCSPLHIRTSAGLPTFVPHHHTASHVPESHTTWSNTSRPHHSTHLTRWTLTDSAC